MTSSQDSSVSGESGACDHGAVESSTDRAIYSNGYFCGWSDAKAGRGYGEAHDGHRIRMVGVDHPICGVVSLSGPNGEPLACGLPVGHDSRHAWASLPTFVRHSGGNG